MGSKTVPPLAFNWRIVVNPRPGLPREPRRQDFPALAPAAKLGKTWLPLALPAGFQRRPLRFALWP